MDLDSRYQSVRDQLYQLGFEQPLPIGSLPIVTALLESSVKTDAALRQCKEQNKKLLEVSVRLSFCVKVTTQKHLILSGKSRMGIGHRTVQV